jgi:MOSC domain-containing protein YiiM
MRNPNNLFSRFIRDLPPGEVTWIGLRPQRKQPMTSVTDVQALYNRGLEGDHRSLSESSSGRQVTIISEEYLAQIAHYLGQPSISPDLLRRNLVVKNINLAALRYQQFRIGESIFEATASCPPCAKMELALGPGGVSAMLGHGGICAKVVKEGRVSVGDSIEIYHLQPDLFAD